MKEDFWVLCLVPNLLEMSSSGSKRPSFGSGKGRSRGISSLERGINSPPECGSGGFHFGTVDCGSTECEGRSFWARNYCVSIGVHGVTWAGKIDC